MSREITMRMRGLGPRSKVSANPHERALRSTVNLLKCEVTPWLRSVSLFLALFRTCRSPTISVASGSMPSN